MSGGIDQLASAFDEELVRTAKSRVCHLLRGIHSSDEIDDFLIIEGSVHKAALQEHWYAGWAGYVHSPESIGGLLIDPPSFDTALEVAKESLRGFTLPRVIEIGPKGNETRVRRKEKTLKFVGEAWLWGLFPAAVNFLRIIIDRHGSGYVTADAAQQFLVEEFVEGFYSETFEDWKHPDRLFFVLPSFIYSATRAPDVPPTPFIWNGVVNASKSGNALAKLVRKEVLAREAKGKARRAKTVLTPSQRKRIDEGRMVRDRKGRLFSRREWKFIDDKKKGKPDARQVTADRAANYHPLDQGHYHSWSSIDKTLHASLLRHQATKIIGRWWPNRPDRNEYWIDPYSQWWRTPEHIAQDHPYPERLSKRRRELYGEFYESNTPFSPEGQKLYQQIIEILNSAYGERLLNLYDEQVPKEWTTYRRIPAVPFEVAWQWTRATWRAAHDIASNWDFELMPAERVDELRSQQIAKRLRYAKGNIRTPVGVVSTRLDRTKILGLVVSEAREGDPFALMVIEAIPARARPSLDPDQ